MHTFGVVFIEFVDLPIAIQKEFSFNQKNASAFRKKLAKHEKKQAEQLALQIEARRKKKEEAEKNKTELAKQKKSNISKLKQTILQHAIPAFLTRRVLYSMGGRPIPAATLVKKNLLVPVHGKYMLVNNIIYLVKDNTLKASTLESSLKNRIKGDEKQVAAIEVAMTKADEEIRANVEAINQSLANSTSARENCYNEHGQYVGTAELDSELSQAQLSLVNSLNKKNRSLDKANAKRTKAKSKLEKELVQNKKDLATLFKDIQEFVTAQSKYVLRTNPQVKLITDQKKEVEQKLKKLRQLFEQGLLSKEVYDKKVVEVVDKYIKE